ncbi:MAG: hypothetical protein ACLQFI_17530, partial [Methylocella sp.]
QERQIAKRLRGLCGVTKIDFDDMHRAAFAPPSRRNRSRQFDLQFARLLSANRGVAHGLNMGNQRARATLPLLATQTRVNGLTDEPNGRPRAVKALAAQALP